MKNTFIGKLPSVFDLFDLITQYYNTQVKTLSKTVVQNFLSGIHILKKTIIIHLMLYELLRQAC